MNRLHRSDWVGSVQLLIFLRALISYNFIQRYTQEHSLYKIFISSPVAKFNSTQKVTNHSFRLKLLQTISTLLTPTNSGVSPSQLLKPPSTLLLGSGITLYEHRLRQRCFFSKSAQRACTSSRLLSSGRALQLRMSVFAVEYLMPSLRAIWVMGVIRLEGSHSGVKPSHRRPAWPSTKSQRIQCVCGCDWALNHGKCFRQLSCNYF